MVQVKTEHEAFEAVRTDFQKMSNEDLRNFFIKVKPTVKWLVDLKNTNTSNNDKFILNILKDLKSNALIEYFEMSIKKTQLDRVDLLKVIKGVRGFESVATYVLRAKFINGEIIY